MCSGGNKPNSQGCGCVKLKAEPPGTSRGESTGLKVGDGNCDTDSAPLCLPSLWDLAKSGQGSEELIWTETLACSSLSAWATLAPTASSGRLTSPVNATDLGWKR
eukprot:4110926-Amphidinium_carterae.1